jgi:hypothetical protein
VFQVVRLSCFATHAAIVRVKRILAMDENTDSVGRVFGKAFEF